MDYKKQIQKIESDRISHDLYDKILRELPKNGKDDFIDIDIVDADYLQNKGFIIHTHHIGDMSKRRVKITPLGNIFITEGGFKLEDEKEIIELNYKIKAEERAENDAKTNNRNYCVNLTMAILALLTAAWSVYLHYK